MRRLHGRVLVATLLSASACVHATSPAPALPAAEPPVNVLRPNANVAQQGSPLRTEGLELANATELPKPAEADVSAAVLHVPETPNWDIEVRTYEATGRVAYYVSRFSGRSREYIASRLSEGTRYEPMIRDEMRKGGIPEDMYYLAFVESGYNPNAYSSAAAVGMWQFMSSTARGMGLRVDWWVDERRDPIRSTRAAVQFLSGLRDQFGSIYLAAAAYNGGPGRISRGLTRFADDLDGTEGDDLFFALADQKYLRNETQEYVPQLIAAALIAKQPAKYGMEIKTLAPFAYDSVRVPALTSLASVARATGTTVTELRALNPQILRGMAPPKASVMLRIPSGTASNFDSAFATIPDSLRAGARVVRTKGGETGDKLAKMTGVGSRQVTVFNVGLKRGKSGAYLGGQVVYVPTRDAVAAATSVPDPSIERYGSSSTSGTHVVKKGENLGSIAKRYRTTVATIMRLNGFKKSVIFPGQEILVSGTRARPAKKPTTTKASASKPAAAKPVASKPAASKSPAPKAVTKPALATTKKPSAK